MQIFLFAPCLALLAAGCGSNKLLAPVTITTSDSSGQLQTLSLNGPIPTSTNPFFQVLGTNQRTCNSCHQLDQGWSVSASAVQARFDVDGGLDPIFNSVDGTNCPTNDISTVTARTAATTLLRQKGLIRIARPIPANAEFALTAVDDPYNCSVNGLSLYRRPLPSTNLRFNSEIMWDGRETTGTFPFFDLRSQATNATLGHAQAATPPTDEQLDQIVQFETSLFTAQSFDNAAGPLNALNAQGGPQALSSQDFFIGINDPTVTNAMGTSFNPEAFGIFKPWTDLSGTPSDQFTAARQAIARGEALFNTRTMIISGVAGLNDDLNQPVILGTCTTCHDAPNAGSISSQRLLNIGVGDTQFRTADMPLYTLTCNDQSIHEVSDPGLALSTGKCKDIGKFKTTVLRGLAARAPYFHDGSAKTLSDVVSFYRTRFHMTLTLQERSDLVAFMNSL